MSAKPTLKYNVVRKNQNGTLDLLVVTYNGMKFFPAFMLPNEHGSVVSCRKHVADAIALMIGDGCYVVRDNG